MFSSPFLILCLSSKEIHLEITNLLLAFCSCLFQFSTKLISFAGHIRQLNLFHGIKCDPILPLKIKPVKNLCTIAIMPLTLLKHVWLVPHWCFLADSVLLTYWQNAERSHCGKIISVWKEMANESTRSLYQGQEGGEWEFSEFSEKEVNSKPPAPSDLLGIVESWKLQSSRNLHFGNTKQLKY